MNATPERTDTPRCDEKILLYCSKVTGGQIVLADFARQLERELAQANARVGKLEGALRMVLDNPENWMFGSSGSWVKSVYENK